MNYLDLDRNNITDTGAEVIAQNFSQLTKLTLLHTSIADIGTTAIARHFPKLTKLREGSIDRLNDGGVAVVYEDAESLSIGDTISVELGGGKIELPVVAAASNRFDAPSHFVSDATLASVQGGLFDCLVHVSTESNSADQVQKLVAETPGSILQTKQRYVASASNEVDSFLNLIYTMLSLTVVIAVIGIANTTTLSLSERLREVGMLRAIGTTRKGVRRIIRIEAVLIAFAGTIAGTTVTIGFGWAFITVTGGADIPSISWPWTTLVLVGVDAIIFGIAVASFPAWRAAQKPALENIGTT